MKSEDFIVVASPTLNNVDDFDHRIVSEHFLRDGVLLCRGFGLSIDDFYRLAKQYSVHLLIDPGEERSGGSRYDEIQSVTAGENPLNFHREWGQQILDPDLIMFYCENPPLAGGETTLADGVEVWNALPSEARSFLVKNKIKYYNRFPISEYLGFLGIAHAEGWEAEVRETLAMFGECEVRFYEDHVELTHTENPLAWQVGCHRHGFVSSFLPGVYPGLACTLQNGDPLPPALISDVNKAMEFCAIEIRWQKGDVIVIDNARWFHGRRSVRGNERRIFNAVGYSTFRTMSAEYLDKISRVSRAKRA